MSDAAKAQGRRPRKCPQLCSGTLTSWDLNALSLAPTLDIQSNRFPSPVAPATSVWFTAATTTKTANDHGLLVNLDPQTNRFRVWDIDTRLGTGTGLGANFLDQSLGAVWVSSPAAVVNRLDPVSRSQLTWTLPVDQENSVIRGIKGLPDGTLNIALENLSGPGTIRNLNPTTDRLTTFTLPSESAPFSGDLAPDGTFFFCEFATKQIARLDMQKTQENLTEWTVVDGSSPTNLFVDPQGIVWFATEQSVGRLDPETSEMAIFKKAEVVPQDVAPIQRTGRGARGATLIAVADANPFLDLLCVERPSVTGSIVSVSTVNTTSTIVTPAPSRPLLSTVRLEPETTTVQPVDPPGFTRYAAPTPTLAITEHQGALFANGVDFLQSIFRLYRLAICGLD